MGMTLPLVISEAYSEADYALGCLLFKEYAEQELQKLPLMYGSPAGCLLLVRWGDARPPYRGANAGRAVALQLINRAQALGLIETPSYYPNPLTGAIYKGRSLEGERPVLGLSDETT